MTTTRAASTNQGIIRHLSFDIRRIVFPFLVEPLKNMLELESFLFIDLLAYEREAQVLQEHHELYLVAKEDVESHVHLKEQVKNIRQMIATSDATDGTRRVPSLNLKTLDAAIADFNQRYGKLVPITVTLEKQINGGFILRAKLYSFFMQDRTLTYLCREPINIKAFIRPEKRFSFEEFSVIKAGEELLQQASLANAGLFAQPTPAPVIESLALSRRSEP